MKKYLLTLLIVWTACVALKAQYIPEERFYDESNNKGKAILMHFNFGTHLPAASMAKRFGQDMTKTISVTGHMPQWDIEQGIPNYLDWFCANQSKILDK